MAIKMDRDEIEMLAEAIVGRLQIEGAFGGAPGYDCSGDTSFSCPSTYHCSGTHKCSDLKYTGPSSLAAASLGGTCDAGVFECDATSYSCKDSNFKCGGKFSCTNSFSGYRLAVLGRFEK